MRQDSRKVGNTRQHDEGVYESAKSRLGSEIDAREHGSDDGAEQDGVERVAVPGADLAEEGREGGGVVAG